MAKKSKAKKSAARKSTTAASKAGAAKVTPTYLKEGASYRMGLHDVIRAVKMIDKHKHLAKLVNASKKKGTSVHLDANTVNLVKDFVVKHKMHADPVGKHIVNAAPPAAEGGIASAATGNPAECNFGKAG